MKNVIELRNELCAVFNEIRSDTIKAPVARELVNAAGKIINSVRLELEYAALRKEVPIIEFLGGDDAPSLRAKSPLLILPGGNGKKQKRLAAEQGNPTQTHDQIAAKGST